MNYKKCIDCGNVFVSKHAQQVRCPTCQKIHVKNMQSEYKKHKRETFQKKEADPNECVRKATCKYSGKASGMLICNYLEITGRRRGCPVKECTKYQKK